MLVMIFFFTFCINADAVTLRQLYNELSSLEKSYNASKARANLSQAEMANIKASIASAEAEIKQAQQELHDLFTDYADQDQEDVEEELGQLEEEMAKEATNVLPSINKENLGPMPAEKNKEEEDLSNFLAV